MQYTSSRKSILSVLWIFSVLNANRHCAHIWDKMLFHIAFMIHIFKIAKQPLNGKSGVEREKLLLFRLTRARHRVKLFYINVQATNWKINFPEIRPRKNKKFNKSRKIICNYFYYKSLLWLRTFFSHAGLSFVKLTILILVNSFWDFQ